MRHTKQLVTINKDVYTTFDGKEFDTEKEAINHETVEKDKLRSQYNHANLMKEFERLVEDRGIFFAYDYADGFFIKVTGDGFMDDKYLKVADLDICTHHHTIEGAIQAAIDYLKKNNR